MEQFTADALMRRLTQQAKLRRVRLHPSFASSLEIYASHPFVRELPEEAQLKVLMRLGEEAIDHVAASSENNAGGGAVRYILNAICHDPFSDCRKAAARILGLAPETDDQITLSNPDVLQALDRLDHFELE